ncbi:MAG: extracellular solute-binding protein family 1 [Acidimicrobiaceae bacterium]|nr:extracellular solute-binding protein family 1 [Acidimicrobiaceae bacterium]
MRINTRTSTGRAPSRRRRALSGAASIAAACTGLGAMVGVGAASTTTSANARAKSASSETVTVWTDATRLPGFKLFETTHPGVHLNIDTYSGDNNGASDLQTKIGLYNRVGNGWPDVVFSAEETDAAWTSSKQYHFAAPLNAGLVPSSTLNNFATGALATCTFNGKVYCLRNDIGQNVLWYNKTLLDKFGYKVPTTWSQYQQLGEQVAKQHPGYVIGTIGDAWSQDVYFWASECPSNHLISSTKVEINTSAPDCTRVANLLDPLIADSSLSKLSVESSDFAKQYGSADKVLMEVGPSWYGEYIFELGYKVPSGQMAAALPPTWPGDHYTGDVGGGIYMVSQHAKNPRLAAEVATWMATSTDYQKTAPTYPAYRPAAQVWLKAVNASGYFAVSPANVFARTANDVWPGWSSLLFSTDGVWADTVVPGLTSGKSLSSLLPAWGTALKNQAQTLNYSIVTS